MDNFYKYRVEDSDGEAEFGPKEKRVSAITQLQWNEMLAPPGFKLDMEPVDEDGVVHDVPFHKGAYLLALLCIVHAHVLEVIKELEEMGLFNC